MNVASLDHLVLTVKDIEATCHFYTRVLGMMRVTFQDDRVALAFGRQKINLHLAGQEFEPKAHHPVPGSADLCFLIGEPIQNAIELLQDLGIQIVEGPARKTGATGPLISVYVRDPDGNLIEIAHPA